MKILPRNIVAVVFITAGARFGQAQQGPSSTNRQFAYFNYFFTAIADPSESSATLQRRESTMAARFGMNQAETSALHGVAARYYILEQQGRAAISAIAQGKTSLSDTERVGLANLEAQRRQTIVQLANALLTQLRPEIVARFTYILSKERPQ